MAFEKSWKLLARTTAAETVTAAVANTRYPFTASAAQLPANLPRYTALRVRGRMTYSTPALAAATTCIVTLGGVDVVVTPPLTNPTGAANLAASFEVDLDIRAVGTSGSVEAGGTLRFAQSSTSTATIEIAPTLTAVNTTQVLPLLLVVTCGGAGNAFVLRQLKVEAATP